MPADLQKGILLHQTDALGVKNGHYYLAVDDRNSGIYYPINGSGTNRSDCIFAIITRTTQQNQSKSIFWIKKEEKPCPDAITIPEAGAAAA